jgi:hypothetical protein
MNFRDGELVGIVKWQGWSRRKRCQSGSGSAKRKLQPSMRGLHGAKALVLLPIGEVQFVEPN